MDGVPFDSKKSVIPHEYGCVKDPETGKIDVGLYVAGWIKRGPVGIVDATLRDSMETFKMVKHHLENDYLDEHKGTIEDIKRLLRKPQNDSEFQVIDKASW